MGNKIRIKQIDLQGIFSASNQVDILSASNYAQFVTQLDTTMSSDAELAAVSSSISESIYTINQVIGSGLISGSSQINALGFATTGSNTFVGNQTISGSIYLENDRAINFGTNNTYVGMGEGALLLRDSTGYIQLDAQNPTNYAQIILNADNEDFFYVNHNTTDNTLKFTTSGSLLINEIPYDSHLITTSSFNSFTTSYNIDSSSFDSRIGTEKGRIDAILSASNANTDTFAEIVSLINSVDLDNDNAFATFYTSSNARISSIENSTGSYELKGSGILSGSVSYLDLTNIPSGIVSQSTDLSSLNLFTESLDGRVSSLENATGSYLTSLSGAISSSSQLTSSFDTRYTLSGSVQPLPSGLISGSSQLTSSFDERYTLSGSVVNSNINTGSLATTGSNTFNGNQTITGSLIVSSVAVVNGGITVPTGSTLSLTSGSNIFVDSSGGITGSFSGSVFGIGDVLEFSSSIDTRINNIISVPNGTISGSSQLTSSFDTRYILSGSSVSINTGSFATTGSNVFIGTETISGSLLLSGSFSYNGTPLQNGFAFAQPQLTRILDNTSYTGSSAWITSYNGNGGAIIVTANVSGYRTTGGLGTAQLLRDGVAVASQTFYFNIANYHTPLPPIVYVRNSETGSHTYSIYFSNILADTNDYATINVLEYGNSAILPATLISGSSQLTSSFDTRYEEVGRGIVSGSSQLTASYDTRYTLSGSVVSGTTPAGTISGSSQLTSSFDSRYVQTGSFNSLTASFNSFTASAQSVTTGSNSFNGTQTITGSLIITTGSFIASQVTANTASLYLTSGSNMYVQNDGVVEITGSLIVSGSANFNVASLNINASSGDEGGEIQLAIPVTNTSLENRVNVDVWQNRFRVFEGSANAKGIFIDLSKAPDGASGEITWKASGYVDAGTFVQLDNIKATVTTSGNRGLSIGAVSTNFTANIGGTFSNSSGAGGNSTQNIAYTTTASTSVFGWNFIAEADTSTYIINDKTNSRMYRITMMIGPAYLGNFISIERLH